MTARAAAHVDKKQRYMRTYKNALRRTKTTAVSTTLGQNEKHPRDDVKTQFVTN